MGKVARELRDHLLQQSKQVQSSHVSQQRRPEWECCCGCTKFLDRTCCSKCGAARLQMLRISQKSSSGATRKHQPSGVAGSAQSIGVRQCSARTDRPAGPSTAVFAAAGPVLAAAVPGAGGSLWEQALSAVEELGASEEFAIAIQREWENADPTNPRFRKPQDEKVRKAKALCARLNNARWCVKLAERRACGCSCCCTAQPSKH